MRSILVFSERHHRVDVNAVNNARRHSSASALGVNTVIQLLVDWAIIPPMFLTKARRYGAGTVSGSVEYGSTLMPKA